MKTKLLLILLLASSTISAQLTITPGIRFFLAGNLQLILQNSDLINNGDFTAGNSRISFTGNTTSAISGSQPIQFSELEMNKTNNTSVTLQRNIDVKDRLLFTAGFLNLNSFNADLGTTGHLDGEQENTRIIGPNGGAVLFTVNLNSPTGTNPANLGIFITAGPDLGNVTIRRGHQSQVNSTGLGNSILRYYDIIPANNTDLNASLRFKYFDGELNNLVENSLVFFKSQDNINWTSLDFSSRDMAGNFVEKNAVSSFGRFTLSSPNGPLPVRFISFNTKCERNDVDLKWKTAQEQGSSHFNIERSADAVQWLVIGSIPAAGNSNTERSYAFTDNNPVQNSLYRIAEHDLGGSTQYTSVLRSSCNVREEFNVWPNPVQEMVFINILTSNGSTAIIKLFDSKGALVKKQKAMLLPGSNQLNLDMRSLPSGVYSLSVQWNNGQTERTTQVLKQ